MGNWRYSQTVYFITDGIYTKIGKTDGNKSVNTRLSALQTGNPKELKVAALLHYVDHYVEKELHRHFKKKNMIGEWFLLSPKDIMDVNRIELKDGFAYLFDKWKEVECLTMFKYPELDEIKDEMENKPETYWKSKYLNKNRHFIDVMYEMNHKLNLRIDSYDIEKICMGGEFEISMLRDPIQYYKGKLSSELEILADELKFREKQIADRVKELDRLDEELNKIYVKDSQKN